MRTSPLACTLADGALAVTVTRAQFDALAKPLIDKTLAAVKRVLRDAKV